MTLSVLGTLEIGHFSAVTEYLISHLIMHRGSEREKRTKLYEINEQRQL
jgi:hypothetical protein